MKLGKKQNCEATVRCLRSRYDGKVRRKMLLVDEKR